VGGGRGRLGPPSSRSFRLYFAGRPIDAR
jgi:hypothetical protein